MAKKKQKSMKWLKRAQQRELSAIAAANHAASVSSTPWFGPAAAFGPGERPYPMPHPAFYQSTGPYAGAFPVASRVSLPFMEVLPLFHEQEQVIKDQNKDQDNMNPEATEFRPQGQASQTSASAHTSTAPTAYVAVGMPSGYAPEPQPPLTRYDDLGPWTDKHHRLIAEWNRLRPGIDYHQFMTLEFAQSPGLVAFAAAPGPVPFASLRPNIPAHLASWTRTVLAFDASWRCLDAWGHGHLGVVQMYELGRETAWEAKEVARAGREALAARFNVVYLHRLMAGAVTSAEGVERWGDGELADWRDLVERSGAVAAKVGKLLVRWADMERVAEEMLGWSAEEMIAFINRIGVE